MSFMTKLCFTCRHQGEELTRACDCCYDKDGWEPILLRGWLIRLAITLLIAGACVCMAIT